ANAEKIVNVLKEFGFQSAELTQDVFLKENRIIRMGVPPLRIEISTGIDGVTFGECYAERVIDSVDGVTVSLINLRHKSTRNPAAEPKISLTWRTCLESCITIFAMGL
ncbi:MAG TPA: hypothetical protein VID27_01370, partial [Blastocatellia bacterium]